MTKKYSGERELIVQTVTRPFDVATGLRLSEEFYGFVFPVCLALVPFPSHSLCCVCVCVCLRACVCLRRTRPARHRMRGLRGVRKALTTKGRVSGWARGWVPARRHQSPMAGRW